MSKVSVIIPAYNQGCYLGEAIDSVVKQTYPDFEVIVVDDGSTDHTPEVVASYSDERIRYIYQDNRGLSAARNTGIRHSTGIYLSFLDSDDLFLPEKLALLVEELKNKPEIGLVAGQAIPIDEHGNRIGAIFARPFPEDTAQLLLRNPVHVGSVMLRRHWQEKVGFFDETLRSYEDWDMWLRLGKEGCKMGWVDKPVSLYRFHPAQMTRIGSQMTTANFAVLDKIFSDPKIPESWQELHDEAYCYAYLRAAANAYHSRDCTNAEAFLGKAVALKPELLANNAQALAHQFYVWAALPKESNPLAFLEYIYNHLPERLSELRQRRRQDLSRAAIEMAFESYRRGDLAQARYEIRRAFIHCPS